jgi:hypothetical protein
MNQLSEEQQNEVLGRLTSDTDERSLSSRLDLIANVGGGVSSGSSGDMDLS